MDEGQSETAHRPVTRVDQLLARIGRLATPVRSVVGLATIGLQAYWPQFPGLRERLLGYARTVADHLSAEAEVVDVGMVDTAEAGREAGARLARAGVDLTVIHAGTYATSSQLLPLIQRAGAPALVLNLQPADRLDYGVWRHLHPYVADFTWFSSAGNAFRIDHAHLASGLARHLSGGFHSHSEREEGLSDHASLVIDLTL